MAYLATVRKDGGPRVHPVSPALIEGNLYAFLLNGSPKQQDLLRDGGYALHSWPYPMGWEEFTDDQFYLTGRAILIDDQAILETVVRATGDSPDEGIVFELLLERVLHTCRAGGKAVYTRWQTTE